MIEWKPFKAGMDLLTGDGAKADAALRDARNVVVDAAGEVVSRPTPELLDAGVYLALYAAGDELHAVTGSEWFVFNGAAVTKVADTSATRAAFAVAPEGVVLYTDTGYWLYAAGAVRRVDIPKLPAPLLQEIDGVLLPGAYKVAVAAIDPSGVDGPISWSSRIDLPRGGGIRVITAATPVRVYLSHANGAELWYATGGSGVVDVRVADYGRQAAEQEEDTLPFAEYAAVYQGRLWALSGGALFFSQAYRYGVMSAYSGFMVLPGTSSGLAALDGPLFIGTSAGAFVLTSSDTERAELVHAHAAPVVPGSMVTLPGEALRGVLDEPPQKPVACWFTGAGHVVGLPDGTVVPLSPGRLALLPATGRSATFSLDGETYVATFLSSPAAYERKCVFSKPAV